MSIIINFEDIYDKSNSFTVEHPNECPPLVGEIIEHRAPSGTKRFRTRDVTFIYSPLGFEGLTYTVIEIPERDDRTNIQD